MLRELTEYSKCIRKEMKATISERKKTPQETKSEGKEVEFTSITWNIRKK